MPIRSEIAPRVVIRQVVISIICIGLALWGAYDLWVSIPAQQRAYETFVEARRDLDDLDRRIDDGHFLSAEDRDRREQLTDQLAGEPPTPPSKFDEIVQWLYISLFLYPPYAVWSVSRMKRRVYELDEEGNLTLPDGEVWKRDDIRGINMEKWMAKSIARVIHVDSREEKLDAYFHKNMENIIGHIAQRFEPDRWHPDGRRKVADEEIDTLEPDAERADGGDVQPEEDAEQSTQP